MNNQNAIIAGSLGAIAKRDGVSLAETFLSANVVIIVDTSGSMDQRDSRGGNSRFDVACEELARLQNSMPGKIAVISFSNDAQFCPSGYPVYEGGSTKLHRALEFCKVADVPEMKFIVISDGQPDSETDALRIAATYTNKIDTIYVGPEDDYGGGQAFLKKLAKSSGGQSIAVDRAKELAAGVKGLLLHS